MGELELVQATPLDYLDRLALTDAMFSDGGTLVGAAAHKSGIRLVTAQPLVVGERPSQEAIIAWMQSLGFAAVGRKTYWTAAERIAIFDAHPGNVLLTSSGRLCPIDIAPCLADAEMTAFMNTRVKARSAQK